MDPVVSSRDHEHLAEGAGRAPRFWVYCHVSEERYRNQVIEVVGQKITFIEEHALVFEALDRELALADGRLLLFWEGGKPAQDSLNGWQSLLEQLAWTEKDAGTFRPTAPGSDWMVKRRREARRRARQIEDGFDLMSWTAEGLSKFHLRYPRIHVLSPWDLDAALTALGAREGGRLFGWFLGPGGESTYDSPKVPEAMVRIKLLGSGTPVLRLDWDALVQVSARSSATHVPELIAAARRVADRYTSLRGEGHRWVMVSGGYRSRATNEQDPVTTAVSAYATRVFPALKVTPALMKLVRAGDAGAVPDRLIGLAFDAPSFHRFLDGLGAMGADKDESVISGALLTLSTACIVDSPPFAGLSVGVLWIDDYLKCALHKALDHIQFGRGGHGRVDQAEVPKARPPVSDLGIYVLGKYIPSVVLGCIVDRWIFGTNRPDRMTRRYDRAEGVGLLPTAIRRAMARGSLDPRASLALARSLKDEALERLREVRATWMRDLKDCFAGHWASGTLRSQIPDMAKEQRIFSALQAGGAASDRARARLRLLRFGLLGHDQSVPSGGLTWEHVNPALVSLVDDLIGDMLDYIALCCRWGDVVEAVRNADEDPRRLGSLELPDGIAGP